MVILKYATIKLEGMMSALFWLINYGWWWVNGENRSNNTQQARMLNLKEHFFVSVTWFDFLV